MKELEKVYRGLTDWMKKRPEEVLASRKHLQDKLIKKRFVYGDAAMQTTLMPVFLKRESLEKIRRTSTILNGVVDRVINLYFEEEYVREYFPSHFEIPKEWLHASPVFSRPTVLNRLDVIFDGETLKYIEFNTDNPGGKGWVDVLERLYLNHPMYQDLIDFSEVNENAIVRAEFDAIMECFEEFEPGGKPRVAFVGLPGQSGRGDEEIVRDYFIERGVEANLLDPRDFESKNSRLFSNRVEFNTVIRSMTAFLFLRYPREMRDFLHAVRRSSVCLVNPFRSLLGSEKSILSFMTHPLNHKYFSKEEVEVITEHVPWTRKFDETVTLSREGEEVSIKEYMSKNRESLVIKPTSGAGGWGVLVGKDTDPLEWNEAIVGNIGSPYWIVQDYVEIPEIELPVIKQNKVVIEKRFLNFSPYVFGGRYAGILGRVSDKSVINVSAGGGVIPVYPIKEGKTASGSKRASGKASSSQKQP